MYILLIENGIQIRGSQILSSQYDCPQVCTYSYTFLYATLIVPSTVFFYLYLTPNYILPRDVGMVWIMSCFASKGNTTIIKIQMKQLSIRSNDSPTGPNHY